jgi:hypothetical protein
VIGTLVNITDHDTDANTFPASHYILFLFTTPVLLLLE